MIGRRGVLLLGGGAAATLGAALWLAPETETPGVFAPGALAFPDLAARLPRAARIEIARGAQRTALRRDGEAWRIEELGGYPARPARVRELLTGLTELRLVEERGTDATTLERLGLAGGEGALALRVMDAAGAPLVALELGRRRVRAQGNLPESVPVRLAGEARAWLAEGRLPAEADPQLWVERELVTLAPDRLRRVEIERVGEAPLVLARAGELDAPLAVVLPPDTPPLDALSRDEVGRAFDMLTFTEVRPAATIPGEPLGEARFLYTDDVTLFAWPRVEGEAFWVVLAAAGGPEAQAIQARIQGWAYQLGSWKEQAIIPRLAELLPR
jgi:hypothetical protein